MILRMMVLKIDPKLVDTMLSLAKGEHAVGAAQLPGRALRQHRRFGDEEGGRRKRAEARE